VVLRCFKSFTTFFSGSDNLAYIFLVSGGVLNQAIFEDYIAADMG